MATAEKKEEDVLRNNPAGRLLLILKRARELPPGTSGVAAWGPILGLDESADLPQVFHRLALFVAISGQIERQIVRLGLNTGQFVETWRKPFNEASKHISLHHKIEAFNNQITEGCIAALGFVSYELNRSTQAPEVSRGVLDDIRKEIKNLIDKIQSSADFSPSLSEYLLHHLFFILDAIDEYEFSGIVPVRRAINAAIGTIATDPDAKTLRDEPLGKEFWKLVFKVASIASIVSAGSLLLEKGIDMFISSK